MTYYSNNNNNIYNQSSVERGNWAETIKTADCESLRRFWIKKRRLSHGIVTQDCDDR